MAIEQENAASVHARRFRESRGRAPSLDDREEFLPRILNATPRPSCLDLSGLPNSSEASTGADASKFPVAQLPGAENKLAEVPLRLYILCISIYYIFRYTVIPSQTHDILTLFCLIPSYHLFSVSYPHTTSLMYFIPFIHPKFTFSSLLFCVSQITGAWTRSGWAIAWRDAQAIRKQ